jgi:hypothetical protein
MRKTAIALLALGLAAVLVAPASATVFYTETFSLPDQPLGGATGVVNPATGWLTHSNTGGGANDIQILGNMLVGSMANAPDDSRPFGAGFSITTGPTDKTYSCMKLYIPGPGAALTTGPVYFAHFKDNIPTGTTFTGKLFVGGIAGNAGQFNMGISNGPTNTPIMWPSPLNVDTWYVIATRFDAATGIATLWVNPADENSASISGTDAGATGRGLAAYAFRQSTANWGYKVDDLSVGTSFDETCANYPTPVSRSTWGRIKSIYR